MSWHSEFWQTESTPDEYPQKLSRRSASRDSTNQNALFVEWFSSLWRAVFWGVYGEIFALFQACVGNFHTIRPWKVVGTLYPDISYVTFKYFAFLSVCDKFELLGHVQAAMMIWVLFLPFFLDPLLVTVRVFFFFANFLVYLGLPLLLFPLRGVESVLELRDRLSQVAQLPGNGLRKHAEADVKRVTPNLGRVCTILTQKR